MNNLQKKEAKRRIKKNSFTLIVSTIVAAYSLYKAYDKFADSISALRNPVPVPTNA